MLTWIRSCRCLVDCGLVVWSWCVRGGSSVYGRRLAVMVKKKENLRRLIGMVAGHKGGKSSGVVLENRKDSCAVRWRFSQWGILTTEWIRWLYVRFVGEMNWWGWVVGRGVWYGWQLVCRDLIFLKEWEFFY